MDIESGKEQPPGAQPPTHGYIQGKGDLDTRVLHVLVALISRPLSSQSSSDVDPIWNSNQEYLIAVRTDGPCAGLWEFPGGKVEADESLYDALCREIKEEVGINLKVQPQQMILLQKYSYPDRDVTIYFFLICVHAETIQGIGRWVTHDQLRHLKFPDANRAIIKKLKELL